jgi:hypothetical protein
VVNSLTSVELPTNTSIAPLARTDAVAPGQLGRCCTCRSRGPQLVHRTRSPWPDDAVVELRDRVAAVFTSSEYAESWVRVCPTGWQGVVRAVQAVRDGAALLQQRGPGAGSCGLFATSLQASHMSCSCACSAVSLGSAKTSSIAEYAADCVVR